MIRLAAFLLLLVSGSAVWADSWFPPSKTTYRSPDKAARLTVTPRALESGLAYFDDKVEGREPAGAPAGTRDASATATLERRGPSGRWETIWTRPLDNEVAPVDVVVAKGGRGFATFDNWHSTGYGPNAIVVYDGEGKIVRRLGLADLFPEWFVASLPRSVSSIHWRGEPRISERSGHLIVPVIQPSNEEDAIINGRTLDLAIRLSDGAPVGLERPEWKTAMIRAASVARESCKLQQASTRIWNAPISAPATWKEEDWHHYLRETQYRTKWSPDEPPTADTTVLRPPGAADFKPSVEWLAEALTEPARIDHDLRAIGSPDFARLTAEIERIAPAIPPGRLKGVDLVIIADPAHADRIRAALAGSGANLELIDPARSFPQIEPRVHKEVQLAVCQGP
ncbi:MAG: hypothetical protein ABWX67_07845 [Allosphingosinicella sp.]